MSDVSNVVIHSSTFPSFTISDITSDIMIYSSTSPTFTSGGDKMTMTPSYSDTEVAEFLHQRNMDMMSRLTIYLVFLVSLMVCGLAGNSIVFAVYYYRFKPSNPRTFILAMSLCDLLTNVFALCYEMLRVRFSFTFHPWGCKVFAVAMTVVVNFSAFVLVAVALERKKMVCGNHVRSHAVDRFVHVALFVCSFLAVAWAIPRAFLFGESTVRFPDTNITGVKCDIQDVYEHSLFRVVYTGLLSLLFLMSVVIVAVCYVRIGIHLLRHKRKTYKSMKKAKSSTSSDIPLKQGTSNTSDMDSGVSVDQKDSDLGKDLQDIHVVPTCNQTLTAPQSVLHESVTDAQQGQKRQTASEEATKMTLPTTSTENLETSTKIKASLPTVSNEISGTSSKESSEVTKVTLPTESGETKTSTRAPAKLSGETFEISSTETKEATEAVPVTSTDAVEIKPSTRSPPKRSGGLGTPIPSRTTLMLFVFTVFFVLNFLPYLTIQSMRSLAQESRLQAMDINLLVMCFRSFYLNSAINPFVYSFCSAKFRYECRQLARSLIQRWRRRERVVTV